MNKTPIEFLIDHYGCKDENELQNYLGGTVSVAMITEVMEEYAEFYHQSELRKREAKIGELITLSIESLPDWTTNFA